MATRLDLSTEYIITHVPTAPSRVRQRGYDQAELIARALARRLDWPHRTLLARTNAARQLGQTRSVRLQQLHQAFRVLSPETVGRQPILLVDDVLTTGSTCEAAAAALRAAGAAHVSAAIFAAA
ncbi:MAG TPA: phosphoribosyltransferase family protein [Candidatus Saccharimonadales bacterium]|nr:phosphoribosyltransferase family protein [Candidatus Saccharimonadales bacterium]